MMQSIKSKNCVGKIATMHEQVIVFSIENRKKRNKINDNILMINNEILLEITN